MAMAAPEKENASTARTRKHSFENSPIGEVYVRARKRIDSLNEPGHSEELQFSASRKIQYLSGIAGKYPLSQTFHLKFHFRRLPEFDFE